MNQIEALKADLLSVKPRSQRRIVIERKLVHLVLKQLRLENRKDRSRLTSKRAN